MIQLDSNLLRLRYQTTDLWTETVLSDFNCFLNDHAQAEKKASGMALSMLSHYPDRTLLVSTMIDLSIEELVHFREVLKLMQDRGLQLENDEKDPYVNQIRQHLRKEKQDYLLDRLLTAAIIEARGCERFGLVAQALQEPAIKDFYQRITDSESKHHQLFIDLASEYFSIATIAQRLDQLLDIEADIVQALPVRAALH